jgi:hypothetical protein
VTKTTVDAATGALLAGGKPVFPIGLSDPPPVDGVAPGSGRPAWAEIASAGVTFARNYTVWTAAGAAEQLLSVRAELDAASAHGMQLWVALAGVDNDLSHPQLLAEIVDTLKGHPGLGAWKGADEPAHGHVPAAGCVSVHRRMRAIDPDHPLVLIEAPRGPSPSTGNPDTRLTVAAVKPYSAACDIHGIDIYPVSKPPGLHAGGPPVNTDISVVGDMTRLIARATPTPAIWTTLQIAWSGVIPPHPLIFPTLPQARFMAYDAMVAGARGLFYFGGQIKQAMSAADQRRGWNWTYWKEVQRPLLEELTDTALMPSLTAPISRHAVKSSAADIAMSPREAGGFLYVIAVRRSATGSERVRFSGIPAGVKQGTVLAHPGGNPARPVKLTGGAFTDPSPFAAHNARVYRFRLPA